MPATPTHVSPVAHSQALVTEYQVAPGHIQPMLNELEPEPPPQAAQGLSPDGLP